MTMDGRAWLLLIVLSVLWGGTFFFIGVAIRELPPMTIVFIRLAVAAAVLVPLGFWAGISFPSTRREWSTYIGLAICNTVVPFTLAAAAQLYITSSLTSVLNATIPVFTVIVLALFREEALTPRRIAAVVAGLLGVIVLRGFGLSIDTGQTIGILLILSSAMLFGLSSVWVKRRLAGIPPIASAAYQCFCGAILMIPLMALIDRPWLLPMPHITTWLSVVIGLGIFSTALGFLLFFRIMETSGPSNAMLVTLLVPVSAIMLGHFVLGDRLEIQHIVGALIIGLSLVIMDGRILRLFSRTSGGA